MEIVFILLPLALLIAGLMLALFIWAVRGGQFDDLETPAVRILFDDQPGLRRRAEAPSTDPAPAETPSAPSENTEDR